MSPLHIERYEPANNPTDQSKTIVVLLHGGAMSHRFYKDVTPCLTSEGYEILVPDLPGHGQSVAAGPFTFAKSTELLNSEMLALKHANPLRKVLLVGVSLGGQAVLDLLQHHPASLDGALVSGVSIHPPSDTAAWEMPHMPNSESWIRIMTEDVTAIGIENVQGVQQESFSFQFQPPKGAPPVLCVVGEGDTAMAKRDFEEVCDLTRKANGESRSLRLDRAWHNHPVDVPVRFAETILGWAQGFLREC